jgi:PPM family protein phosphatase
MQATRTRTASHSIVGRRSTNQDAVFVGRLPDGRELLAIADGMGGHQGGETASKSALTTLVQSLKDGCTLKDAIVAANAAVYRASTENPDLAGMGTTLVTLLRSGDRYFLANVGDSRAYRISNARIERLTSDHSFLAEALASGQMTEAEAKSSRWKNALTRAIGTDPTVEPDLFGPFDMSEAHTILLCSDGLHGVLDDAAIGGLVTSAGDPSAAAQTLVHTAFENGSKDNITVALVAFGERPVMQPYKNGSAKLVTNGSARPTTLKQPSAVKAKLILSAARRERTWLERLFTKD